MLRVKKILLTICLIFSGLSTFAQIDTVFWFAAPWITPDHWYKDNIKFHVSAFSAGATVRIQQPASTYDYTFFVPPNQTIDVTYTLTGTSGFTAYPTSLGYDSLETRPANVVRTTGFKITSDNNITVVYDVITRSPTFYNPETFSLKGRNGLGKEFVCPFQTRWNNAVLSTLVCFNPANPNAGGIDLNCDGVMTQPRSQINIVATQSNTVIWIKPSCNIVGHVANVTYSVLLPNPGDAYTIQNVTHLTSIPGNNLSGTTIVSDKNIAVTVADDSVAGVTGCYDLMGDQIVPVDIVGKDYIVVKGAMYAAEHEGAYIVGTQNFTQLTINDGVVTNTLINKGDTYHYKTTQLLTSVVADKDVYVLHATGFGCELGEALLPPLSCAGSTLVAFSRNNKQPFRINLLCRAGAESGFSNLGAFAISAASFAIVPGTAGQYVGAQFSLDTLQLPVGSYSLANSIDVFALGVFNGDVSTGGLYHYMSSFLRRTAIETETTTSICSGGAGTVALTGTVSGAAATGVWSTSHNSGTTSIQGGGTGTFGTYTSTLGTISTVYFASTADTTFVAAQSKTITLFLTSTGLCKNVTDSIAVVLYARPLISTSTNSIVCKNNVPPIVLSGTVSNALNGNWSGGAGGSFGVPGTVTTYTPSQADIQSGSVTLSLTSVVPLPGCANSSGTFGITFINSATVTVVPTVTQVCTNSTTLALNGNVSGVTTTGAWVGGSGVFVPTNASPTTTYILSVADLGQPNITLTLSSTNDGLCASESATMLITVIQKPQILLPVSEETVCASTGSIALSGTITALAPLGTWYSAGTGSIVQGNNVGTVTATYFLGALDKQAGVVNFTLQSNAGICPSESSTLAVQVIEPPLVNLASNFVPVCKNATIAVSGTVTGFTSSGIWSTSSATTSPGTFTPSANNLNGQYIPSQADIDNGFVILTLSSTGNGVCPASSAAFTASFIPAPAADFVSVGKRCLGSAISFSSNTLANGTDFLKYNWDFGDNSGKSQVINPIKTYTNAGSYVVTLTVTGVSALNVECPDVRKRTFVIKPTPVASFTASPACEDQPVIFTNRSFIAPGADPIIRWEYNFGDIDPVGNQIIKLNPSSTSHLYKKAGSYVAALTVTAGLPGNDASLGCISETQLLQVDVLRKPNAEFGMTNNPAVVQEPIYFSDFSTPTSGIKSWYWQFGDDAASNEQAPNHAYQIGGLYNIILTVTDLAGCQDSALTIIDVSLLPQVAAAFSPNGDGNNDELHVKGGPFQGMVFKVYNNWGQLLFETNDQNVGWDGKWNGTPQPNGVYVWTLVVDMYNNRQVKKNGDVTIVR